MKQELEITLEWCDSNGYIAIPYGGGSSVVWGVNPPDDCGPCVTIASYPSRPCLEIDECRVPCVSKPACSVPPSNSS